ncbi:hypothetical protein H8B02_14165 [Bradyrhizobium sp. Pear77]|uniref:hypothetical protein n=1 Tax=Bradyrhizobium TaxID=374 RepID=UPI001E5897F8|nr:MULTISPECIES: hypothetical protein [Bradyrhizobium]MCC8954549.1 hypothetical protein [Bradyrhizobium altum]MCC8965502.1 hypothetical protein [Bradyrhizobium oropedii]
MMLAMPLLLAETTRINLPAATKFRMPDDKRVALSKPAGRPETVLSVNASTELDSQGPQAATFQTFRSSDSIRPTGLLENAPAAPENHLTAAANSPSCAVNGAGTRKPSSITMLSICRRVVARRGTAEANTTDAVAIPQGAQPKLSKTPRSWSLDPIKRRCAPNSSASRACIRSLRRYGDVLSPVG